ncbi:hypothetical protein BWI93_05260 [Siphonobacter sp. BAB-5385]|uniref:hypothetical protein n=1 Tax=Siphonobacter sp. BAB-5385 TaxID=1864822 RepID=UPI000B9E6A89|nr:hypothetical protein [Siphonobacter sp. BAB-5385]OZI09214.1 hypothetical protein BWI93_05260 [Siphonobacter sp. BAB-5385]
MEEDLLPGEEIREFADLEVDNRDKIPLSIGIQFTSFDVHKACMMVNRRGVHVMKQKGTCMTVATPATCDILPNKQYRAEVRVLQFKRDCGYIHPKLGPFRDNWDWPASWNS